MSDKNISSVQHHSPRVIVLDSRGELPYVFGLGFIGFVGGTLVPVGGHNLLEPAQWGRPVSFWSVCGSLPRHCVSTSSSRWGGSNSAIKRFGDTSLAFT